MFADQPVLNAEATPVSRGGQPESKLADETRSCTSTPNSSCMNVHTPLMNHPAPGITARGRSFYRISLTHLVMLAVAIARAASGAGLPEPSLVLYGKVFNKFNGGTTRMTQGQIRWVFKPAGGGPFVFITNQLANINDQFSYVLRVPCEGEIAGFAISPNTLKLPSAPAAVDRAEVQINGQAASLINGALPNMTVAAADRGRLERVDLQVSVSLPDNDGDGLPDGWEQGHFGSLAPNPNDDADGDGVSNQGEYQSGTDPNDPQSLFSLIEVGAHPQGGMQVKWNSVVDKSYTLQRSSDLLAGFATVGTNVIATPPINTHHDASATGTGPFFYRLRLE